MKSLLAILLFFPSTVLFGQTIDSIALFDSILDKSSVLRYEGKLDSALKLAKRLQEFPKQKITDEQRIGHVTNLAALLGNFDQAMSILTEEQAYHEKKKNYRNLARIHYSIGGKYFETFNDCEALINFIKADSILERIDKKDWLAVMIKIGIANVFMKSDYETDSDKFDRAVPYINEGIVLADSIDFPVGSSILLEKKGHYLQLKDSLEASINIYKKALKVSQNINYTLRESSIYDGMGKVFFKQKKLDSAAYYFEKHLKLISETAHSMDIAEANYNIGQFYNQISKFQMAKNHLEEAWRIIETLPNVRKEYPYKIQNELAIAYSRLDQPKKALVSLNAAKDLQEEVYNIRNSERISELETRYRTEKKEQEIALLKSQSALEAERTGNQQDLLLGTVVVTSLGLLFLFILYRNRQKTNKKLREIDTLKSNFFTNISHEFRTPLALISAPIQTSLEDYNLSKEKRNHFEIAQKNTQRLSALIDQLLELSKIDSGNRHLTLEKIKPTQLISAWNESFLYLGQQKNIAFELEIQDKEIEAWCDREALENITTNLLGNAVKYTPENGTIQLKATIKDKQLKIEVSNSGNGLTKAQLKTIFNRFYQTDDYSEGAGIGLSLVKELTELHGGSIVATSTPNELTTFTALLSLDKNRLKNAKIKESTSSAPIPVPNKSQITISDQPALENKELPILLVVEDNIDMRTVLLDTFKSTYQVLLAENGEKGIEHAIEQIPDLIISDLMMPIKDGIELTKTLKSDERTSHIPIILLTAKAGDENELVGIDVGADDYMTKPFNRRLLKSKANSLILLRQKLRSRYSQEVILRPKDIAITNIDERFLEKVQAVLDENLIESSFTIEDFSRAVNMSRMQLHRKLKALTGLSASEFIRSQRLKLAAQLLKQSDSNVSQVGYSVGFNDHAYFSKCFKETYNCTPSEFSSRK